MKKSKKNSFFIYTTFFTLLLFFQLNSCYKSKQGCLDVNATNFDVTADETCCADKTSTDCCCTYPNMVIQTTFLAGTKTFSTDSTYKNNLGQSFRLTKVKFYISNLRLVATDGKEYNTTDTIKLDTKTTKQQSFINNFALINPSSSFSYTIASFKEPKTFKSIKFSIGIEDDANKIVPTTIPNAARLVSHPLKAQGDTLWDATNNYVFNKIWLNKKPISIYTKVPIELNFPKEYVLKSGYDTSVYLKIDFVKWFDGVDFSKDTNATIIEKVLKNINASLSLK